MRATRTWIDAVVLVVASTAVISNIVAFVTSVGRIEGSPVFVLIATFQAGLVVVMCLVVRRAWRRLREARLAGQMNVRLVRGDVVLPCQLSYLGVDEEGMHTWLIVAPEVQPRDTLRVGMLPPRTSVVWECS